MWTHIMLHHSLTKDSDTVSWSAIRKYHVETSGWRDIGYHYGVELISAYPEVLIGRDINEDGAHCKEGGMNRKAVGICLVGNFDLAVPSDLLITRTTELVKSLMWLLHIPVKNVVAHRDYATYKSCPGKLFDMDKFRAGL